jgi:aminopeptidase YwaD
MKNMFQFIEKQLITNYRILWVFLMAGVFPSCQSGFEPEITTQEIEAHIAFLASDELKGRYPGSATDEQLSHYIAGEFKRAGLTLYEKRGLQYFDIVTSTGTGPDNRVRFAQTDLEPGSDFMPFPFSASSSVEAELVFAGYGIEADLPDHQWDDYRDLDVAGKWVMILRGIPGEQEPSSPLINYSEDRGKALLVSDMGAAGVILVSGENYDPEDALVELKGRQSALSIPVIQLKRNAAEKMLSAAGSDSLNFLNDMISQEGRPASFATGLSLAVSTDLRPEKATTFNGIAFLKGADPVLRNQFVVVGAHHDHLGLGGPGTSSRAPDTVAVHYGADDNASGVAGVLEIAEYLASRSPSRSIMFATFGAEEMGLIGSKYLTEHTPVDLVAVQAMINLDMVGRLNDQRQVQIGGVGTSPGLEALADSLNLKYGFELKFSNEGYGPSDHASFYAKDIPVLFITTGAHPDYHTPADKPGSINLEGAAEVMAFAADLAESLANKRERIAFTEAGPKVRGSSRSRRGGITLGLMPDVTYDGNKGMPVMFVTEGRPAAVGGVQKGDTIVAIEGKSVGNVYDYMNRLDQLKEGMDIVVTVNRGGDRLDLVVRL